MKKHIVYISSCVDKNIAITLSGVSIAGNNMNQSILKRLHSSDKFDIHCFTVLPVAPFPKDSKLCYAKAVIPIFDGLTAIRVSFLNIPVIKQITQALSLYRNAKAVLKKYPDSIIFTNNVYPQTGIPVTMLKKRYPGSLFVSFLGDLPIDFVPNRRFPGKLIYKCFYRITEKIILKTDKLIVHTKDAIELYAPGKPYIIVEGGVETEDIKTNTLNFPHIKRDKVLVFSGTLIWFNGIMELIEAMELLTTRDIKLHIYGDGELKQLIADKVKDLPNAEYMGMVDNLTMKNIQSKAYLLVNPRPVDNLISMVTFPSKTFEYLVSGTPVLTTRLSGYTEDYYDKMFFTESNNPVEMAKKIDEIMLMPPGDLEDMANKARKFALEEKSWDKQMSKVIGFITND